MRPGPSGAHTEFSGHGQAGRAEQGVRSPLPPHAPTARVTVPHPTELHRAVAGVPLSMAQPAAPVHCHVLPGVAPPWTLQRPRHRAGDRAQHWHRSHPPAPGCPRHSQALQVDEAQEGTIGESCQGILGQVPVSTQTFSPTWHRGYPWHLTEPWEVPMHPQPSPARPRPWQCSPTARAQRSLQSC